MGYVPVGVYKITAGRYVWHYCLGCHREELEAKDIKHRPFCPVLVQQQRITGGAR